MDFTLKLFISVPEEYGHVYHVFGIKNVFEIEADLRNRKSDKLF